MTISKTYKLASLFDGSGGFPLAASLCGIKPVWASEVEPYPIAVTSSRFPNMKHLGSVTDVNGAAVDFVDIITFGSPCQDLSVAGKRAGLKHTENGDDETTRSGLFMEAIRIIKEMREATNGVYPRFAVWENVPGAFSSNQGEDFRIVLEEFIKVVEPTASMPTVPKNGWPYADSYCGDGWSIAYRVFDAQYWGVPQRRRRIYLVADFGGQRAGKILFEREGVRGYLAESGTQREAATGDAESGSGTADCPYTLKIRSGCDGGGKGALVQTNMSATLATNNNRYLFQPILNDQGGSQISVRMDGKAPTLRAEMHGNVPCVMDAIGFDRYNQCSTGEVCETLRTPGGGDNYPTMVYSIKNHPATANNAGGNQRMPDKDNFNCVISIDHAAHEAEARYIVRRQTPTECARLQGFPDKWGHPDTASAFTDEEYAFWLNVRNTHAAINGKAVKDYTREQMLTWYNKLHTDSSEYKMWGNGIALPCALYIMQGIAEN